MPDVELGTLYEMNKELYKQIATPSEKELGRQLAQIGAWFSAVYHNNYYMLLCREKNDYTIFKVGYAYNEAINEIKEVLESRGTIVEISYSHEADFYECWIRDEETKDISMYAFFPCDDWVIEVE